ncbi:hypothetical protein [Oleiharenicola lentus]|uniref:hypothetical protein n=1 Tax=Oleiharenicola lentus TaxID=2508720 RepID=UPI003F68089E
MNLASPRISTDSRSSADLIAPPSPTPLSRSEAASRRAEKFGVTVEKIAGGTRRYIENFPRLDIEPIIARSGDDEARTVFMEALAEFDELEAARHQASDIRFAERALARLRKAGIQLDSDLESRAYFQIAARAAERERDVLGVNEAFHLAHGQIWDGICANLAVKVKPTMNHLHEQVAADLETQLARFEALDGELLGRWPAHAIPQRPLGFALADALARIYSFIDSPLDFSRTPNPRSNLSQFFPAGQGLG